MNQIIPAKALLHASRGQFAPRIGLSCEEQMVAVAGVVARIGHAAARPSLRRRKARWCVQRLSNEDQLQRSRDNGLWMLAPAAEHPR